jgi:hypothetical protein
MVPTQGTAETGGRVSYVPQNPWCQNLSLRDNITFGMPFDEERYARVSAFDCCVLVAISPLALGQGSYALAQICAVSAAQQHLPPTAPHASL